MILPTIIVSLLSITSTFANVTPKLDFNVRLKGLDKKEKEQVLKLEIFHADTDDVKNLGRWFCMTTGIDHATPLGSYKKLRDESCNETLHSKAGLKTGLISMCDAFEEAELAVTECPSKLFKSECMAIYMYSSEFYTTYNPNVRSGHWEPYTVFTAILYQALSKLDKLYPLPENTVLYRGMDKKFDIDSKGRFYFKHFVSTTLDEEVAEVFGSGTIIVIIPDVPIIAAQLQDLSKYPGEEEVLISPFEAFEFINKTDNKLYFKSSRSQDFINNPNLECQDNSGINPGTVKSKESGIKILFKFESSANVIHSSNVSSILYVLMATMLYTFGRCF